MTRGNHKKEDTVQMPDTPQESEQEINKLFRGKEHTLIFAPVSLVPENKN